MALIKALITPQGVVAQYHKLLKVEVNTTSQIVESVFAIYATAEARDSGKSPLWHEYVRIPFTDFKQDPRSFFYDLVASYREGSLVGGATDQVSAGTVLELKDEAKLPV